MNGLIGRHVVLRSWFHGTYVEKVGEVVACELQDDGHFALLVARDDGSLSTGLEDDARLLDATEFKRLLRNERRRSRQRSKKRST